MSYSTYARAVGAATATVSSAAIAWVGLNILSLSAASSIGIAFLISAIMGLIYQKGPSDSEKSANIRSTGVSSMNRRARTKILIVEQYFFVGV